jgi:hypothetical protein
LLLGHLGDLYIKVSIQKYTEIQSISPTFVTRKVARSSRSPNLDPIRSPAAPPGPPRRAGGTYEPFLTPGPAAPAAEGSSPMPAATSAAPVSPIGAIVSL